MTAACTAPDAGAGVALLLSEYLDCQARALGANGFQAFAGGSLGTGLLTGVLTIFIGIIGYRFLLGETPGLRDGAAWAVRAGIVLALLTGWAAFHAVVYNVAVEGPRDIAGILLPASGLPAEGLDRRVQTAYDTIRLGSNDPAAAASAAQADSEGAPLAQRYRFQPASPRTASLFVISTLGFTGALRIGVGFLLAVAPIAILCLLFEATLGLFSGWVRAVSGLALATVAATITTSLGLVLVETEIARVQALRFAGSAEVVDPQALTVIVVLFAVIMLVTVAAAMRMTNAFRLPERRPSRMQEAQLVREAPRQLQGRGGGAQLFAAAVAAAPRAEPVGQARAASLAGSLAASVRREQLRVSDDAGAGTGRGASGAPHQRGEPSGSPRGATRRGLGRRTRSAVLRDRSSLS